MSDQNLTSGARLIHCRNQPSRKRGVCGAPGSNPIEIASPRSQSTGLTAVPSGICAKRTSVSWRGMCATETPARVSRPDVDNADDVSRMRGRAVQMQSASIMADDVSRIFSITDQLMSARRSNGRQVERSSRRLRRTTYKSFLARVRSVRQTLIGKSKWNTDTRCKRVMFKSHRSTGGAPSESWASMFHAPS